MLIPKPEVGYLYRNTDTRILLVLVESNFGLNAIGSLKYFSPLPQNISGLQHAHRENERQRSKLVYYKLLHFDINPMAYSAWQITNYLVIFEVSDWMSGHLMVCFEYWTRNLRAPCRETYFTNLSKKLLSYKHNFWKL